MNEKEIIRIETYKKLLSLKKQYFNLPHNDFLCDGAEHVWSLIIKIIEKIISRFDLYTHKKLQLINTLFPFFEKICGFLDDSKTKNVPWSIIPSLESLFVKVRPDTKFVICPLWETNYQIYNRNIIEIITSQILNVPELLFDASKNISDEVTKFLEDYPSGIYFVFYPRTERLSVLHFPLLGHEIGHIYSLIWLNAFFKNLVNASGLENTIRTEIKSKIPPNSIDPLFESTYIDGRLIEYFEIYKNILAETISDIVGAIIFGQSTLFSSYMFALKFGLDDFRGVQDGYLPWRFRINFICKALKYMKIDTLPSRYNKGNEWVKEIYEKGNLNFSTYTYPKDNKFVKYIVDFIELNFDHILKNSANFIDKHSYTNNYNEMYQKIVYERLQNGIIPNCVIDEKLNETPIGLRNIVAGTWIYLCEIDKSDYKKYIQELINANLLSLKAIELSYYQKDFNNKKMMRP